MLAAPLWASTWNVRKNPCRILEVSRTLLYIENKEHCNVRWSSEEKACVMMLLVLICKYTCCDMMLCKQDVVLDYTIARTVHLTMLIAWIVD